MNKATNIRAAAAVAMAAIVIAASSSTVFGQQQPGQKKPAAGQKKSTTATSAAQQRSTVTINHGYTPSSISVKAGKPVELTLVRKETSGCGDTVQFPSLGIKRILRPGEKTVVRFTPKKAGTLAFTCGMNMYRGAVVVK